MALTNEDIRKIGTLARLKLSDEEVAAYKDDFAGILEYVDQLQSFTLPHATAPAVKNKARLRLDQVEAWPADEQAAALDQAPHTEGRQLKVKRIL